MSYLEAAIQHYVECVSTRPLSVAQTARELGVAQSTVRGWHHRGVPYAPKRYTFGRDYFYVLGDVIKTALTLPLKGHTK